MFFLIPITLEYWPPSSSDVKHKVSGLGLSSATVNHPAHILIELIGSSDKIMTLNITTELEHVSSDPLRSQSCETSLSTDMKSPSWYKVSYTLVRRGKHKLHVQINNEEIDGSPFTVIAYPNPYQLDKPVSTVTGVNVPYGVALTNNQQMIVSERGIHSVSIFDAEGRNISTFGYYGDDPKQMIHPRGIAVDETGNIYVTSRHKLQKFNSSGKELIDFYVGGSDFDDPCGIAIYKNHIYVCDRGNHRIQVFDLNLTIKDPIGSGRGSGRGQFDKPYDIKFDIDGNMYVSEYANKRVQVMDSTGNYIRQFEEKMCGPRGLLIADKYVYVTILIVIIF